MKEYAQIDPLPYRFKIGIIGRKPTGDAHMNLKDPVNKTLGYRQWKKDQTVESKSIFSLLDEKSITAIRKANATSLEFTFYTQLANTLEIEWLSEAYNNTNQQAKIEIMLPFSRDTVLSQLPGEKAKREFQTMLNLDRLPLIMNYEIDYTSEELQQHLGRERIEMGKYIIENCEATLFLEQAGNETEPEVMDELREHAKKLEKPFLDVSLKDETHDIKPGDKKIDASTITKFNAFNKYKVSRKDYNDHLQKIIKYNFDELNAGKIKSTYLEILKHTLYPHFIKASLLAKKSQKLFRRTGWIAYSGAFLSVLGIATGIAFIKFYQYSFFLELILLAVALIMVGFANHWHIHRKWIENRFLTERIRVAHFFFISNTEVIQNYIYPYTGKKDNEEWIIRAFEEIWEKLASIPNPETSFSKETRDYIAKAWLKNQLEYHKRKSDKTKTFNKQLEYGGMAVFGLAIIVAILHIVNYYFAFLHYSPLTEKILIIFALALPALGATMEGVRKLMEYSRNSKRSKGMVPILEQLISHFSSVNDQYSMEKLMRKADTITIRENQDWMFMYSVMELELVV